MATKTQRNRQVRISARPPASNAGGKRGGEVNAYAVLKLKLEHIIVLQALEDANRSHKRAVGVSEIAAEISERDQKRLKKTYSNSLPTIIGKTLELLRARGLVFSPGAFNRRRFYGSVHVLDAGSTNLPDVRSRRHRVLELIFEAVQKLGRAVRCIDILQQGTSSELIAGLNKADITHDVLSLLETGELAVVGRVRGEGKGLNLYLPSDLDADSYRPKRPLTWLDEVARAVEALWAERAEEAQVKGMRPKPLTTGDIRSRIVNSAFYTLREVKKDPQIIVDAVKNLAGTRDPLLRKIKRRGQKALLWVPIGVADEDVDFGHIYANDAERMGTAVERAVGRLGRPVTVRDIQDEVEADFALEPVSSSDLFKALSYASRETFDAYDGKGRKERRTRRVCKIGRAGSNTYYYTCGAPEAHAFVEFRCLELLWSEASPEEQFDALQVVSLPCVARGRAMLLAKELDALRRKDEILLTESKLDGTTRREAEGLKSRIDQTGWMTRDWLAACDPDEVSVPSDVAIAAAGWTAMEFLQVVKPLYPLTENITSAQKFITLMHDRVRRLPNSEHESRFSNDPHKAAEFLFDRTDALIYAAKHWGGPECLLQAALASQEMGRLRDPRFVFPALAAKSFESRLAGVACLAFVWSDEGTARLKHMAEKDPDPGVRQSALWAYGFSGGAGALEVLCSKATNDQNERVRKFASDALEADDGSWWKM